MSDLIVIIDNWKHKPDGTIVSGKLSENIINFIEATPSIKTAVLASYACSTELFSDTVWYNNRRKSIKNYQEYVQFDYITNLNRKSQTWDVMLNYVNERIFQIAMREIEELINYVNAVAIRNIYVAGAAWEICVKDRPLGYLAISKHIPNVNLLVDTTCVIDATSNIPNMSEYKDWLNISDVLYQYHPTYTA